MHWGCVEYTQARQRQLELWSQRIAGRIADTLIVVEHPAVVTLGRHAPVEDLLVDHRELARRGIALVHSDRGGRATYHGPGQAVIYPIVAIGERGLGVKQWVGILEDALVATLGSFGIVGQCREGQPGIWVGPAKIASIGLRVARGVSYHGASVNVESRSKSGFDTIVTCGVREQRVTSIEDELGAVPAAGSTAHESFPAVREVAGRFCARLIAELDAAAAIR